MATVSNKMTRLGKLAKTLMVVRKGNRKYVWQEITSAFGLDERESRILWNFIEGL